MKKAVLVFLVCVAVSVGLGAVYAQTSVSGTFTGGPTTPDGFRTLKNVTFAVNGYVIRADEILFKPGAKELELRGRVLVTLPEKMPGLPK